MRTYICPLAFPYCWSHLFEALHAPMIGNDVISNLDRIPGDFEERLAELVQVRKPHGGGG